MEVKFSRTFVGVRGKRRRVAYAFFSGVIEICHTGDGKECVVTLVTPRVRSDVGPLRSSHGRDEAEARGADGSRRLVNLPLTLHAVRFRPPMPDAVRKSMSQRRLKRWL